MLQNFVVPGSLGTRYETQSFVSGDVVIAVSVFLYCQRTVSVKELLPTQLPAGLGHTLGIVDGTDRVIGLVVNEKLSVELNAPVLQANDVAVRSGCATVGPVQFSFACDWKAGLRMLNCIGSVPLFVSVNALDAVDVEPLVDTDSGIDETAANAHAAAA